MSNKKDEGLSYEFLTDELIYLYSESNILTEHRDINTKYKTMIYPYDNGIFDRKIFGSVYSDQCNCGDVKSINKKCIRCGSMILDTVSAYSRFARIDSPVYYCSKFKYNQLIPLLKKMFNWEYDIKDKFFYNNKGSLDLQKVLEVCQFNYDQSEDKIIATDSIDDFKKCSFEGLLSIIQNNFTDKLSIYKPYINKAILVCPIILRPLKRIKVNGEDRLKIHQVSAIYQNIIYATHFHYNEGFSKMESEANKSMFLGILRRFLTNSTYSLTRLFNASKENYARIMQSNRLSNSGRCTIVPAPDLKVDEVYIPRHLMYEACRDEFIKFLMDHYRYTRKEAERDYKLNSNSSEIQTLFEKYIDGDGDEIQGKYVIINRNPRYVGISSVSY